MQELTHFDAAGAAHMVDVGGKPDTARRAVAEGRIVMQPATLALIRSGGHRKGDVLGIARIAGIMAAKRTAELIPLAHPIPITRLALAFETISPLSDGQGAVHCRAEVQTLAPTGVEMEALVAVQIALATIYDMCKAVDRGMRIEQVQLLEKSGGRSGEWRRDDPAGS